MEFLQSALPYLLGLGGLATGTLLTWLIYRSRVMTERVRTEERGKAAEKAIVDLEAGSANLESEVQQLRHTERALLKRQGELEVLIQTQHKDLSEKQHLLKDTEARMAHSFKILSDRALKSSQEQFLDLAKSAFEGQSQVATSELEQRRIAVETLVRPVAQTLDQVQNRINELEKAREGAYAGLTAQVRQMASTQTGLQSETAQLVKALRQPRGRGQWGELQLKRVVELAGLQEHCDFVTPGSDPKDPQADHQPDLVIQLPAGKQIVIDSRAPLDGYLDALEAEDDAIRDEALQRHVTRITDRIKHLASPEYRDQFPAEPEFVVLFLPSESSFSAALAHDSTLIEAGAEEGVILATPTSLVALLRAVATGWRQEDLANDARRIADTGRALYSRLQALTTHFAKVGASLDTTVRNYNQTVGALDTEILPGARQLGDLGTTPDDGDFAEVSEIDLSARHPRSKPRPTLAKTSLIDTLATTGEVSEDRFEGFAADGPESGSGFADLPSKSEDDPTPNHLKSSGNGSENGSAPVEDPDPEGAADDLRAALTTKEKQPV